MKKIGNVTAAYIAGLIDGEGYVCFNYGYIAKRRPNIELVETYIRVTNSYKPVLVYLESTLDAGSIHRNPPKNPKHKMVWFWKIGPQDTFALLRRIAPYLQIKRELANLILKNKALITKQGRRTEGERIRLRRLKKKVRLLNKRGT
jgi:hypothetical protein